MDVFVECCVDYLIKGVYVIGQYNDDVMELVICVLGVVCLVFVFKDGIVSFDNCFLRCCSWMFSYCLIISVI